MARNDMRELIVNKNGINYNGINGNKSFKVDVIGADLGTGIVVSGVEILVQLRTGTKFD